jgi:hypothetical protein
MKKILILLWMIFLATGTIAQRRPAGPPAGTDVPYWNQHLQVVPYRLVPAPAGYKPQYVDLDGDGDPDILKTITVDSIPVMWIDDDDDMKYGDLEGDVDNDCLLIDRNKDGVYGGIGDLIVDWVGGTVTQPPMQLIVDYPKVQKNAIWPNGHYMWVLDNDHDGVFNYIDWNTLQLESWAHSGNSDFFPDYSGKSTFMKVHAATNRIEDLKMNWENPFLFYDPDHDGLSEMAVRLVDSTSYYNDPKKDFDPQTMRFSGKINWVSVAVDMDNDNRPGDEFDFDMTLGFRGGGFDYTDQVHKIDMGALPGTDSLFVDSRWRHLDELVYADHDQALPLIFGRGKWNQVYFVYDEDDDCHRWERVEFYDPLDPFKIGTGHGGIDNNSQADPAGDRGEWDLDNSGKGKLYISRFDGRIHLYGAELGIWRIDEAAQYYQGWDRRIMVKEPSRFATVKYEDADHDGFMDRISYDLDGDTTYETVVDLGKLGLDDRCPLIDVSRFSYQDYVNLQKKISANMWNGATEALKVARKYGLDTDWYARLLKPASIREKYDYGYWLQFYLYRDLCFRFMHQKDQKALKALTLAYYGGNWDAMLR